MLRFRLPRALLLPRAPVLALIVPAIVVCVSCVSCVSPSAAESGAPEVTLSPTSSLGLPPASVPPAHVATPEVSAPAVAWGPATGGLRMRVDAPTTAARGDWLEIDVFVEPDSSSGSAPPTLTWHDPALFFGLRLTPVLGGSGDPSADLDPGATVIPNATVVPAYRSGGPPDPPPPAGEPTEVGVVPETRLFRADVPLAVAWESVLPGAYTGVVELAYDGSVRGGAMGEMTGTYRGVLVSQPLLLQVGPAPERFLEVRVPASLLGGDVAGLLRLPIRNGFAVGLHYRGDFDDGSTGGSLGGAPEPGVFDDTLARIAASRGRPTFTIFETSVMPGHMWMPGRGSSGYRVLWERR